MALGEAFLTAALQVALEKLASPILREFGSRFGVDRDLKKLTRTLSKIQAVLSDAEARQLNDMAVKLWLSDLKEVAYDCDDVLDEVATEAFWFNQEKQVNKFFSLSKDFLFKLGLGPKIKEINERLDEIAKEREELGLKEGIGKAWSERERERSQTSSLIDESCVFGRADNQKEIVELLVADQVCGHEVGVIPIVGMGGLGKTTLAQLVYNDDKVIAHFELRMWVCVSDDFNVRRLTKSILESAARKGSELLDVDILQNGLCERLRGKRFLLVLDDVWNEKKSDWDILKLPFRSGAVGSMIIVTTRSEKVASIMGTTSAHRLECLSEADCWLLFKERAFLNGEADAHPNLVPIGKEIVKKCRGLPLAANTLGGLLYSKTEDFEWDMILRSDIWDLEEIENEVLPALKLSYNHLPSHLKQCFVYCSIFPKDYNFHKDNLMLLWMAEGFVHPKGRRRLEDVASDYFDDLMLRSFFQHCKMPSGTFVMHDLIHDLAQFVAGDVCFTLQGEGEKLHNVSEKARHGSVQVNTFKSVTFEALYSTKSLRTMLLLCNKQSHHGHGLPQVNIPQDLIPGLRRLRALDLSHIAIKTLPDSVGNLKHLRFLDLSSTLIKTLPESTCNLHNLQTLILANCNQLLNLPKNMKRLANLRQLNLSGCWYLMSMPPEIGKITSLQMLNRFVAGNESGCGIGELKNMTELRGTLCIDRLEDVMNNAEAREASLNNKPHLQKLVLGWSRRRYSPDGTDEELLESLKPNVNIKEVKIDIYHGAKFPNWFGDSSLSHLEEIEFSHCNYCKSLPSLGQLPGLKHLRIDSMSQLETIGREVHGEGKIKGFPSLEKLKLEDMEKLKNWDEIEQGEFSSLRELIIMNCPNIARLPKFPALEELVLNECHEMILNSVSSLTSLSSLKLLNFRKLSSLPGSLLRPLNALKELSIQHFYRLETMQEEVGLQCLVSLNRLKILCCPKLVSIADRGLPPKLQYLSIKVCSNLQTLPKGLKDLTSLEELSIAQCPKLVAFPKEKLPNSLKDMRISACGKLESLPETLSELWNLEYLSIGSCPKLALLPENGLPASVRRLHITNCELLEKRCQQGGEDWPKISHVPDIWASHY